MLPSRQGTFHLFNVFGINVRLHWSWFFVALWQIERRKGEYHSPVWMVWEYLALFGIVLLHEFGHALACRSVGGRSEEIVLWPFGGIAFVQPPPRAGAVLWSIAAGPLVNVVLVPIIFLIQLVVNHSGIIADSSDAQDLLTTVGYINLGLLIFNMLPIYPLDGGQIFQSLLWFWVGQRKSLLIASVIGLPCAAGLAIYGFITGQTWLGIISLFLLSQAWRGFQAARAA